MRVLVLLALLSAATVDGRQATAANPAEYCRALRFYADGRIDAAVATIDTWPIADLTRSFSASARCGVKASAALSVLLITDTALRAANGPVTRVREYLGAAELALRAVKPDDLVDFTPAAVLRFQTDWYDAAGRLMLAWTDPFTASSLADRGLHVSKTSARLLTLSGMASEMRAHLIDSNLHDRNIVTSTGRGQSKLMLLDAQNEFRRAVAADARAVEARVHLGRVLYLRNEMKEAREVLAPVGSSRDEPDAFQYLAHLFLGAVAEFELDYDAGRHEYEAAIRVMPDVQTGYVALSTLEQLSGHVAKARSVMTAWEAAPMREESDPWSAYQNGGFDTSLLDALRLQVES